MSFSGYKMIFRDTKIGSFSEVNGVSSIVKLFLTFWKVKSGQGGVQLSANQKAAEICFAIVRATNLRIMSPTTIPSRFRLASGVP